MKNQINKRGHTPLLYLCIALLSASMISVGERGVEVGVKHAEAHPALLIFEIAFKIYEVSQPDELSDVSRRLIEKTLKAQSEAGFIPLSSLSAQDREALGDQGRLELGIDQLAKHLDTWGDKLSTQLSELTKENRKGHALTQQLLGHMTRAEFNTGLRNLNDGLRLLKQNPDDPIARQTINDAKTALIKHDEFLKQEELAGHSIPVEHWATLRISLSSAYLGVGLVKEGAQELIKLIRLPIEANGFARLKKKLPKQVEQLKLGFFDKASLSSRKKAEMLIQADIQLDAWLKMLKSERQRLEKLKRQAHYHLVGFLSKDVLQDAQREAEQLEDQQALRALKLLIAQMSPRIDWVKIPDGLLSMGSNWGYSDEKPVHKVRVPAFLMSKTEVTVRQYRTCVKAGRCSKPSTGTKCNWGKSGREDHPINCVDWGQARTFAKWVGADVDLPTEAEWEYAAYGGKRGNQRTKYAGSDNADKVAWYDSNSGGSTHIVGTKKANGFGLHDMSGNVWEWTLDEYKDSYRGAPSDGSQARGHIPTCRIKCDNGSAGRVNRGGSWYINADLLRVAVRGFDSPGRRFIDLGFRLRRTLP